MNTYLICGYCKKVEVFILGIYRTIRKQFDFLEKRYGFVNTFNQKHGSYFYAVWSNSKKNIMVLYDAIDEEPISIRIYDADSFSFDAEEYKNGFDQKTGKPCQKIKRAAVWLKNAIEDNHLLFFSKPFSFSD